MDGTNSSAVSVSFYGMPVGGQRLDPRGSAFGACPRHVEAVDHQHHRVDPGTAQQLGRVHRVLVGVSRPILDPANADAAISRSSCSTVSPPWCRHRASTAIATSARWLERPLAGNCRGDSERQELARKLPVRRSWQYDPTKGGLSPSKGALVTCVAACLVSRTSR